MEPIELRDQDAARRFVTEGLWLQRAVRPTAATVRPALEWALEIASEGHPLPPVSFVADLGHVALGADSDHRSKEALAVPGWPAGLARQYEDHVLGKLYADRVFERAGDALRGLPSGELRTRAVAYLVHKANARAGAGGVSLSPAVIRGLLAVNPDDLLTRTWDALSQGGPSEPTVRLTHDLIAGCRRLDELVGAEHAAAVEDRSALGRFELEVGLESIRLTADKILQTLPPTPRPHPGRREVPTRVADEDQYPVGGYSSISNRGSIESLLHSQLAYMETGTGEPDLFDVKFTRDELFYFSRDENQFLRTRRAFVFVLLREAAEGQYHVVKGPQLDALAMTLAAVLAVSTRLTQWLGTDGVAFHLVFVGADDAKVLSGTKTQCKHLFRGWLPRKADDFPAFPDRAAAAKHVADLARTAQVHALVVGPKNANIPVDTAVVDGLVVAGSHPSLHGAEDYRPEAEEPFEQWCQVATRLLQLWV